MTWYATTSTQYTHERQWEVCDFFFQHMNGTVSFFIALTRCGIFNEPSSVATQERDLFYYHYSGILQSASISSLLRKWYTYSPKLFVVIDHMCDDLNSTLWPSWTCLSKIFINYFLTHSLHNMLLLVVKCFKDVRKINSYNDKYHPNGFLSCSLSNATPANTRYRIACWRKRRMLMRWATRCLTFGMKMLWIHSPQCRVSS